MAIPLLTWDILYMLLYFISAYAKGASIISVAELIKKFVLFDFNGFMWFFVPLLLIYLSIPFFSVFVLNAGRHLLRLFLAIGLLLGCIPPLDASFSVRSDLSDIYLMGSRFLYFIVAGYYLGHFSVSLKTRKLLYACSVLSVAVMFLGTIYLTLYVPEHFLYFLTYTNVPCTITAMGVFTYFKYTDWEKFLGKFHIMKSSMARYSSFSLGIYLIQGVWFKVLKYLHICDGHIVVKFLVMYALCVSSVWAMKHMPLLKRIV